MTQRRAAIGLQVVGLALGLAAAIALGWRVVALVVAVVMFVAGSALEDETADREREH